MAKLTVIKNDQQRNLTGVPTETALKDKIKELKNKASEETLISQIKTGEPFISLFPINSEILKSVTDNIKEKGFDPGQPVTIWEDQNILIDGHTRLKAARAAGVETIPARFIPFPDQDTAVQYAAALQMDRRNLTEADYFKFIERKSATVALFPGKTKKAKIAGILNVSERTAQKYINIMERGSDEIKAKVRAGELSINQADQLTAGKFTKSVKAEKPNNGTPDNDRQPAPPPPRTKQNDTPTNEQAKRSEKHKPNTVFFTAELTAFFKDQEPEAVRDELVNLLQNIDEIFDMLNDEPAKKKYQALLDTLIN